MGIGMVSFGVLFPTLADDECRSLLVRNHGRVPDDQYALLEAYCVDPACDCRRVMLSVFSRRADRVVATIAFGFDPDDENAGPYLDPLNPQGEAAEALLHLAEETALAEDDYVARLERHYHLVKAAVNDPEHPVHRRLPTPPPLQEEAVQVAETVERVTAKVGRNEACPCRSGKKFKRCCLRPSQGRSWRRGAGSRA